MGLLYTQRFQNILDLIKSWSKYIQLLVRSGLLNILGDENEFKIDIDEDGERQGEWDKWTKNGLLV